MIRFIDEYRNRFSVEFICKTLKDNRAGGFITSRGYRQSKARGLSARRLRMLCWSTALVLFIGIITASTACGKCGMLSAVTELISVVNKLLG